MKLLPLVSLLLIGVTAQAADPKPRRLLAGAATSNITPEIGTIIVGGINPFPATHIHDELHARSLVLVNGRPDLEVAYAERALRLRDAGPVLDIPVQVLRIGGVGIAAIPCETFVETGLELKTRSPFKPSFTHSIANGCYGYLPTPEHHKLGGYETWLGTNRLEEQTSMKIANALLAMWNEMR